MSLVHQLGVRLQDGSSFTMDAHSTPLVANNVHWLRESPTGDINCASSQPHVLLGLDYIFQLVFARQFHITRLPNGLKKLHTPLGDVLADRTTSNHDLQTMLSVTTPLVHADPPEEMDNHFNTSTLDSLVEKFFSLEGIGITDSPAPDDDDSRCFAFFQKTISYRPDERRYYVHLPFKHDPKSLPTNFGLSYSRLLHNYRNLSKNPDHLQKYDDNFRAQLEAGILEEVPTNKYYKTENVQVLSHHGVVKATSQTTKLRAGLDGSAHIKERPSINDCLYRGPVTLPDITGTLLRTRLSPILVSADIGKAFLMVGLDEKSRDFTRLLWCRDVNKPPSKENLVIYRHCRVPFGLNCSPFLLAGTIVHHLQTEESEGASLTQANDLFVDNFFGRVDNVDDARRMFALTRECLSRASIDLREFVCNVRELNDYLAAEGAAISSISSAKVLGMCWDVDFDTYSLPRVKKPPEDTKWTKRLVLKCTASIYDPLGLLNPVTVSLKSFMQDLWKKGLMWDSHLDAESEREWKLLIADIEPSLISIPRIAVLYPRDGCQLEVHVFTDASKVAFAAVAYIATRRPDGTALCTMIISKARVAPAKTPTTIPRLELLGCFLGAKLLEFIKNQIGEAVHLDSYALWTDSMIVLYWLHNQKQREYSTFIRNRTRKIRSIINPEHTRHIDGELNPADCASRGCSQSELRQHSLWKRGPPFLAQPPNTWPGQPELAPPPVDTLCLVSIAEEEEPIEPAIDISRFSTWSSLLRVVMFVLLFARRSGKAIARFSAELTRLQLLQQAELCLFRLAQNSMPPNGKLCHELRLFRCPDTGLWRCKGRIPKDVTSTDTRFPFFLPRQSLITRLYIEYIHTRVAHFGVEHTLTELRQRVWISKGRTTVKSVIHK